MIIFDLDGYQDQELHQDHILTADLREFKTESYTPKFINFA